MKWTLYPRNIKVEPYTIKPLVQPVGNVLSPTNQIGFSDPSIARELHNHPLNPGESDLENGITRLSLPCQETYLHKYSGEKLSIIRRGDITRGMVNTVDKWGHPKTMYFVNGERRRQTQYNRTFLRNSQY